MIYLIYAYQTLPGGEVDWVVVGEVEAATAEQAIETAREGGITDPVVAPVRDRERAQ